jgi:hypothetical protein
MSRAANDRKERFEQENAAEFALMTLANHTNAAIRQRLEAVASDLRLAASCAGEGGENLLQLAKRFEQHARAGDLQ